MRKIKFRAWDMVNEKYSAEALERSLLYVSELKVGRFLFEQFIGLRDNDGKEIYEGDIVEGKLYHRESTIPTMGFIEWDSGYAAFCLANIGGKTLLHNHDRASFKIIGNIHQNEDLLKC